MNELCTALREAGFNELIVSDLRLDLEIGEYTRTVVLRGQHIEGVRFDYHPTDSAVVPEEILAAWEAYNA